MLHLTLSGDILRLLRDRAGTPKYHPVALSYKATRTNEETIRLKAKTRGNFRRMRENCNYPPLLLNFQKKDTRSSLFHQQDKLKLVVPCRDQNHVIREYLVYKLYNLVTPKSFRARLVKTTFYDTLKKKEITSAYCIMLEEEKQMAQRNQSVILNKKMVSPERTDSETFIKMAVFQYMIGNTDWSVLYLHNTRLIAIDSSAIPSVVPYDFDHSGIVDAPYAMPPSELGLGTIRERRYRGYCIPDIKRFDDAVATFNRLKKDFYNIYTSSPLLQEKYKSSTTKFLDQFYDTINDPNKLKWEFNYPCRHASSKVIIKGLPKNHEVENDF